MKGRILIVATAALMAASPIFARAAQAADPSSNTQPGFAPDSGQINPGHAAAPWSAAPPLPQDQQPAQEDARAALMMPDNGAPSAGPGAQGNQGIQGIQGIQGTTTQGGAAQSAAQGSTTQGSATQGSATQETAAAPESNGQPAGGNTSGAASAGPAGPIGATIQTMPAKFSKRNDLLDHMPMMAWPLPLNEQQRAQIYQTVMADKSQPAADAASLKPASALSFEQRREMQPLPESLATIDGLQGLKYVKGKGKVLLVRPSSGIVVDEVTM